MGVKTLWTVISGSGEMIDLRELQGKSVAIDLAGWIVQNNTCKGMHGVSRPHLRNLFFRTAALINLNIKPIFVLDGDAPDLKKETLAARRRALSQNDEVKSFSRTRLKGLMNECKALLDAIGVESVKSDGEAEALCAQLNADGVVDAVISDDSDAFCYGAKVLLRNFSISTSGNGATVEKYEIDKFSESFKLDRHRLIVMAIMLGCDFVPSGVPGVGKESVIQLFESWPMSWDVLGALRLWIQHNFASDSNYSKGKTAQKSSFLCIDCDEAAGLHCTSCDEWSLAVKSWSHCHCSMLTKDKILLKHEETIKKKCAELGQETDFWEDVFEKVISEFLTSCSKKFDHLRLYNFACPDITKFVPLCVKKLAWTEEYCIEKVLPLISRWQIQTKCRETVIIPESIVKQRTVSGIPSLVVRWRWNGATPEQAPETFETCEPRIFLQDVCSDAIEKFDEAKKKPAKAKTTRKKVVKSKEDKENEAQKPITQFFTQKKNSMPTKGAIPKRLIAEAAALNASTTSDEEALPDNLSFLIDDLLSYNLKRNLSISQPKDDEQLTSTPVNKGPRKKVFTPSRVTVFPDCQQVDEVEEEDSFDRMCK